MSSWLSKAIESHHAQLITTAAVSGFVVASTILGFQQARRMMKVADLKASIPDISEDHRSARVSTSRSVPYSYFRNLCFFY
jgi:hypothetical protein